MIAISIGNGGRARRGANTRPGIRPDVGQVRGFVEKEVLPLVGETGQRQTDQKIPRSCDDGRQLRRVVRVIMAGITRSLYHPGDSHSGTTSTSSGGVNAETTHCAWSSRAHIPNSPVKPISLWMGGGRPGQSADATTTRLGLANENMPRCGRDGHPLSVVFAAEETPGTPIAP